MSLTQHAQARESRAPSVSCGRIASLCFLLLLALLISVSAVPPGVSAASSLPFSLEWSSQEFYNTHSIAWGDYDGDGDLDLAVGTSKTPNRIYRNNTVESGGKLPTFQLVWSSPESDETATVAWGDYDNDGKLDLAVGNYGDPNRIYHNEGVAADGITPIFRLVWSASEPSQTLNLAWGDYDGDGRLDFAADGDPTQVYRNAGIAGDGVTPIFELVWSSDLKGTHIGVAWGDYDNDGKLDLLVGGTPLRVYHNNGVASGGAAPLFQLVWSYKSDLYGNTSMGAWGDYDHDGALDLAVGNSDEAEQVYHNEGISTDGVTPNFRSVWTAPGSVFLTRSIAWSDYDGDGALDLTLTGYHNRVYHNAGLAPDGITPLLQQESWSSKFPGGVWGDYDNDGNLDLAAGSEWGPITIYRNTSPILDPNAIWLSAEDDHAYRAAWGDFDNDGDLDLAIGNNPGPARLYRNDGLQHDGITPRLQLVWTSADTADTDGTASIAWGDYDNDGNLDLVVANSCIKTNSPCRAIRLYRNTGGALAPTAVWSSDFSDIATSIAWGDYDNDGNLDLALTTQCGPIQLLRNEGLAPDGITPVFQSRWTSNEPDCPEGIAWGDFNNDGVLDLAEGNFIGPNRVFRNAGLAADGKTPVFDLAWSSGDRGGTNAAWGDYDGDGDLDLAFGLKGTGHSKLYRNDNGVLTPRSVWTSDHGSNHVAWGDYEGDGDLDLATGGKPVRIYRNAGGAGDGTLPNLQLDWASDKHDSAWSEAWGDYDNDGDLDLLTTGGGRAHLYRNTHNRAHPFETIPNVSVRGLKPTADFYASGKVRSDVTVPFSYKLFHPQGDLVQKIFGFYSLDGGGSWLPALPATGTQTTNLNTRTVQVKHYSNGKNLPIPDAGTATSNLKTKQSDVIANLDVQVKIRHTRDSDLRINLTSPFGTSVLLAQQRGGDGDNFQNTVFDDGAKKGIAQGKPPFKGLYRPEQALSKFDGHPLKGKWTLRVDDNATGETGELVSWGMTATLASGAVYTYNWDLFKSGVTGQSDNVVFRLVAVPKIENKRGQLPRQYLYGAQSSTTFPFRVRGTQARVFSNGAPVSNAMVFRSTQGGRFKPYRDLAGNIFRTDSQGYLRGRGELSPGDQLVALLPVESQDSYDLYYTSATPIATGLDAYTVSAPGVQTLNVSPANPLILLNLNVSLEWDARKDTQFLSQLKFDLERASEFLYDWTNGQAALGRVTIYQDKAHWSDAHIRIYASNHMRPNAPQGGIVNQTIQEVVGSHTIRYQPGQIRLGVVWNRYGNSGQNLGEDWPRALAHELGHYAFYLDDDYLGLDPSNLLIPVDTCPGAMSDPYRADYYSEFHPDTNWQTECGKTLAASSTGRSDWSTIQKFYPGLSKPTANISNQNQGPSGQPLDLPEITVQDPVTPTQALDTPIFSLTYQSSHYEPSTNARAFLIQDDRLTDLGGANIDQVVAHGARLGDRLCLFELSAARLGCETIAAGDDQLAIHNRSGWQPQVTVSPETSRTVTIDVSGISSGLDLEARIFPVDSPAPTGKTLIYSGNKYTITFTPDDLPKPVPEGYVQLWVNEVEPRREIVIDYALGSDPAHIRGDGAHVRGDGVPAISTDGSVIVFAPDLQIPPGEFYTLQALATLPAAPSWTSVIGNAYYLTASANAPSLDGTSISFQYLGKDIPESEEQWAKIYYLPPNANSWQPLPTHLDTYHNFASAAVQGSGSYALMSAIEIKLQAGWNLIAYPIQETRPVAQALESIDGFYTTVYGYQSSDTADPWKVYDVNAPAWVNDLTALEFGAGYWIHATQAVTLYLKGSGDSPLKAAESAGQSPPATYYGRVMSGNGFTPMAGMTITAAINGNKCGQGKTLDIGGQVMYTLNVFAEDPGTSNGCGAAGQNVQLMIGSTAMQPSPTWANDQALPVDLSPGAGAPPNDIEDTTIQYDGWRFVTDALANGGAYRVSNIENDKVTFKFTGNQLQWVSRQGPDQGMAQVLLDDIDMGTVDLYAPTAELFRKRFQDLGEGPHTFVVRVLGTKNSNASDTNIVVDAFTVDGVSVQENNCGIHYNRWKCDAATGPAPLRSNGQIDATACFTFTGTGVEWITWHGPSFGKARVFLDGADMGEVDLYGKKERWGLVKTIVGLDHGAHVIEIHVLGSKHLRASGDAIPIGGFRVTK